MIVALFGRALGWVLHVVASPPLPRRLGVQLRRFALLLVALAALLLLPLHLSPHAAAAPGQDSVLPVPNRRCAAMLGTGGFHGI